MYAVTVLFRLHAGQEGVFLNRMLENAATSLGVEPDCHRFDVCTDPGSPDEIFLYELYTDRAAFEMHMNSEHYRALDRDVGKLISSKKVRFFGDVWS